MIHKYIKQICIIYNNTCIYIRIGNTKASSCA